MNASYSQGADLIKEYAINAPRKPGVYIMKGAEDKILYIGKAKNIYHRILSYTRPNGLNNRIIRMVSLILKMDFIITGSEAEAFLMEADLIKTQKPHFNILLKDDKSYPYILIRKDHEAPQIMRHRGKKKVTGKYFGPFASAREVQHSLDILQKAFLLRNCTDNIYENRSRPCLLYQIKRCSAPCTQEITIEDYKETVKLAEKFLDGHSKTIVKELTEKMYGYSEAMNFEKAAEYRDRLKALSHITGGQHFHPETFTHADIIALYTENNLACIQNMFIRSGQNWGTVTHFIRGVQETSPSDVIASFIGQFYQNKPVPPLILLSHELYEKEVLAQALYRLHDVKVSIETPLKGERLTFVKRLENNTKEAFARKQSEENIQQELLEKLADLLEIEGPLKRIEVYDNAHISGSSAVGGMIVATPEGFAKKEYRTWNIKNPKTQPGDDYAMMREVLTRRLKKIHDESQEHPDRMPDLIILDGGAGQLSTVASVMEEVGVTIPLVAVAKGEDRNAGRERFFQIGKQPFSMPLDDPVLYFVQRMRDEAHRYANGVHQKKREKRHDKSILDGIEGIGSVRKKALIAKFGSARAVKEASLSEIEQTPNISKSLAQKIYDALQEE